MTAFASGQGQFEIYSWAWELRSVNGKGLDLRLRVPDWIDGLETALRTRLGKAMARGNVTLNLRLSTEEKGGGQVLNSAQLNTVLSALAEVETQAMDRGVTLAPSNAVDILALRGVMEAGRAEVDSTALSKALLEDFEAVLESFLAMRAHEGAALSSLMDAQITEIAALTEASATAAEARKPEAAEALRAALARVTENADNIDEARIAQELAVLAVKADVTEEIDRLRAHVAAARDLIAAGSPIGRKLDFLSQEFNREANTLCSKAQSPALTKIGLELKTVIDQMREQVQNVE
ncbi:YicC/YloC family endoribonuclease [Roseovarius sp. 2305UL8-3]|uniref:YicC/YloC family endoribonuclease n=1 Tax=Roseovarius conchicola TaxID=3121636 RepID=UPI003527BE41